MIRQRPRSIATDQQQRFVPRSFFISQFLHEIYLAESAFNDSASASDPDGGECVKRYSVLEAHQLFFFSFFGAMVACFPGISRDFESPSFFKPCICTAAHLGTRAPSVVDRLIEICLRLPPRVANEAPTAYRNYCPAAILPRRLICPSSINPASDSSFRWI